MTKIRPLVVLGAISGIAAGVTATAQNLSTTGLATGNQQFFGSVPAGYSRTSAATPGVRKTARLLSDVEFNDNYDLREDSLGNALIWTTTLGYGVERRTLTDEFLFDVQGSARVSDLPEIGTDTLLDDPRLVFAYDRQVDDNNINFDLRYQRADLDYYDPLSDLDVDGSFDDTLSGGTRESLRSSFGLTLNEAGPVSFDLTGAASRINFFDTDDPDLNDRDRASLRADVGFALSPILRLTTGGFYDREIVDDDEDLDRRTTRADIGIDALVNPRMRAQARIGYSEVDARRNTGDTLTSGIVGDLRLFISEKNGGESRMGVATRLDENGLRHDATVGKTLIWDNGVLDTDIGLSISEDTDLRPIGAIRYIYDLPRARINTNFRQVTTVDDDGEDVINTALDLIYTQQINNLSSFDLGVAGGLQRFEDSSQDDTSRVNLTAQYNRALTRDWSTYAGYRHEIRDSESENFSSSNSIFVGVRRDWDSLR